VPLIEAVRSALRAKQADVVASTLTRYGEGLDHFVRHTGAMCPVTEALTTDRVREFKADRLQMGASQETINNDLGAVSILVTHAVERGWLAERPEIKRFSSTVRISYLEPDQMRLYMAHLRGPFRVMMQLLVGTGLRLGEAEALLVRDLRFGGDGTRVTIHRSKTAAGIRRVFVPNWVSEALKDHIERCSLGSSDPLFRIPRRTVQKEHKRACSLAEIHSYTIHDHRHTAAVHLARAGMPLHLLQKQLGHKHISTTMRYAEFHPEYSDVRSYFDRVEEKFGLSSGPSLGHTPVDEETGEVLRNA
jgi:integrase